MRRLAIGGGISMVLVAIAACATSEESSRPSTEPEPSLVDASVQDAAPGSDADIEPRGPRCSPAGWCETTLPDADLVLRDIWPLPDRAFAIADSFNSGIKVLEWTSTDSAWRYIDDNSQNEKALADFAVKIWAPSADEVYYAVAPGIVFHGRRPVPPATDWSWSSSRLEDNNARKLDPEPSASVSSTIASALGVWGTGSGDVYAWYSNTVFRGERRSDGTIEWVVEYIADDFDTPSERLLITGVAGTNGSDLWVSGSRRSSIGACSIVARKTIDGYRRIADGTPRLCTAREGVPLALGNSVAMPMQLQSAKPNRILFRSSGRVVEIAAEGEDYSVREVVVPSTTAAGLRSLWRESEDHVWLVGFIGPYDRHGITVRGTRIWDDGGVYQLSSTAFSGMPSFPANQIRGTSAGNLWIVGDRYALHKTSP